MRKLVLSLVWASGAILPVFAQTNNQIQHPGAICCDQNICPGDPIGVITENLATTPSPNNVSVEYAWYEMVDDTNSATGVSWLKIPNTNVRDYQPLAISSQYGGFFMRGAKQTGALTYLFSNIVNIKVLSPNNPVCTSGTSDATDTRPQVTLSPNPAMDVLNLVASQPSAAFDQYQVYALDGTLVQSASLSPASQATIAVGDLPSGMYFLHLRHTDSKTSVYKWAKL